MNKRSSFTELLAYNMKRLRSLNKMSQLDLSINTDLSVAFINSIENQQKWVSPHTLEKIANALKAKPHELFLPIENSKTSLHIQDTQHHMIEEIKDILEKYGGDKMGT